MSTGRHAAPAPRATYRDAFAVREFRAVFLADLLSLVGDQIAAVAITIVIYERSQSPLLAAAGYASAYVPWVIGGPLLSAWAERLPGRRVLIGCDLARAGLIGLAAVPHLPLPVLCALVFAAALLAPPFSSARSSVQARVLTGDTYAMGLSALGTSHQVCQLTGLGGGGALVVLIGAPGALIVNALTFLVSAVVLSAGLSPSVDGADASDEHETHATDGDPAAEEQEPTTLWREAIEGLAVVRSDRRLIGPLLLCVVGTAYGIVPEAVAAVLAGSLDHGASGVGVLLAAAAAGSIVSDLVVVRLIRPDLRERLLFALALAGTVPLMLIALAPGYWVTVTLIAAAGLSTGFVVVAQSVYARAVPAHARARAFGLAGTALYAGQSVAILAGGAAGQLLSAQVVIAGAGALGALGLVLVMVLVWHPTRPTSPTSPAGPAGPGRAIDVRDDAVHDSLETAGLRPEALHG